MSSGAQSDPNTSLTTNIGLRYPTDRYPFVAVFGYSGVSNDGTLQDPAALFVNTHSSEIATLATRFYKALRDRGITVTDELVKGMACGLTNAKLSTLDPPVTVADVLPVTLSESQLQKIASDAASNREPTPIAAIGLFVPRQ